MLSLTRSIALRVPLAALRYNSSAIIQRSSLATRLTPYQAFSTTALTFATAAATTKKSATAGRAKPRVKARAATRSARKVKAKPKPKSKAKPKPKPKAKAKPKPASTVVPLSLRPPRKPMTGFLLFYRRTATNNTDTPITEQAKNASTAWKNLSDAEKKSFNDEAKILFENYVREREKWIKNPKNVEILKTLNKDRKKRGKSRVIIRPEGYIKKPTTAFLRFAQVTRRDPAMSRDKVPSGTLWQTWVAREAGTRWRNLPAAEKEKYMREYKLEAEQFKKDHP